jgi:adenosylcobinamide-phosphate synthase
VETLFNFNLELNVIYLVVAVIIDYILGDPRWLPHPIIYIGKLISKLEKSFRSKCKSNMDLKVSGGLIVIIVAIITYIVPYAVIYICKFNIYIFHAVNVLIIWTTLASKSLYEAGNEVFNPLINGNIDEARVKLSYIVGRDTKNLNEHEIIRATVETVSENTSDGVIAPMIFALVGGAPLAMLYKGINTMDSMLGYMNEKFRYIGFFPAKVDDAFNFLPARITGVLMCFVAPVVGGNIFQALKIMIRDRKNHKSPNCAYPEGATAGALKVQLGGTNSYFGELMAKPTIGDNIKALKPTDIFETGKLMYWSELLFMFLAMFSLLV